MSDFVEPITKEVTFTLRKSLAQGEEICPVCKGLGVIVADNPFGLEDKKGKINWYHNDSVRPCYQCYDGVVKRCKYCGRIIPKNRIKCTCKDARMDDALEAKRREQERMDKAKEVPAENFDMYYSDYYPHNEGYFLCFEEFWDAWEEQLFDNLVLEDERPEYAYGTYAEHIKMNADNIATYACEDLYEDAYFDIDDESLRDLQNQLDDWCKTCGVRESYIYDKRYKVKIPWGEEYLDYCDSQRRR